MKTSLLLVFACLLFAFAANLLLASANHQVRDIDGHPLQAGTNYYILPAIRGFGGGLTLHRRTIGGCPIDVVQEPSELSRGLPVKFTPIKSNNKSIPVSTDLKIQFSFRPICSPSTVWELDTKIVGGPFFVTTGGVEGSPFKIEKSEEFKPEEYYYKLVSCPTLCNTCRPICGYLAIDIRKSETRRLVFNTGNAFEVFFKKA